MANFERKTLKNGNPNPKYIDLCDEDPPIAGQKFACISFISPEKIIKKKELFLFEKFIDGWDFTKSMDKFMDFIHFVSYKYNIKVESLNEDFIEFVKEEKAKLTTNTLEDDFKNFLDKKEDELNTQFQKEHAFQTSTRGLKVRGVFPTQEEAEIHCKHVREYDANHDIYVGPIGMWIPWDPDAYKTGRVEFMEEELNQLHSEKIKNEAKAKLEFDRRIKETKKKAIEENIEKASKSGNVLTQTMNEEGNLIGIKDTVDFESREVASADMRNELMNKAINKIV
jgi:hypothetical protein